ncbi:hypothetical protein [Halorarius litoreus]|uniref:hypothetical protein n=1 Tax=Halorarius litoreus TaxID=2962676 RepID=UPI0020CD2F70|nr:hypothetical protein [Halorarius litoreus]
MSLSDVHRRLADLIDRVETSDVRVTAASPDGTTTDGTVTAELTVELSVTGGALSGTTEGEAGGTREEPNTERETEAATTATEPAGDTPDETPEDEGGSSADESGESEDSTSVPCKHDDCEATFETPHGMKIHYTKTHVGSDAAIPAYRDPERLREAYAEHETLTGVKEALDADVAVTTIRRHLLEHDIHDPGAETNGSIGFEADDAATAEGAPVADGPTADESSSAANEDADGAKDKARAESPSDPDAGSEPDAPEADPMFDSDTEVAPGVTVDTFREALHGATTVSGVQRALDLDRETTVDLLREYDLLDVVGGRVARKPDHETVRAEVDDRLRSRLTA